MIFHRFFFVSFFLATLFSFSLAVPVQAQGTVESQTTIINALPTGMRWNASDYTISYDTWRQRTTAGAGCSYSVPASDPPQCRDSSYIWDANHRIQVNGVTYQCHRVENADSCSTSAYVPQESRAEARCTTVRTYTSATTAIDERRCAACSGDSCDFFLGVGAISKAGTPVQNTPGSEEPGASEPLEPATPFGSGTGTGNGTGNGDGDGNGTPEAEIPPAALENPLNADSLEDLLLALVQGVVRIGAIALLVFLVYVGFQFVAAQGNEEKLRDARTALIWTIVGGVILLGAEMIVGIIRETADALSI